MKNLHKAIITVTLFALIAVAQQAQAAAPQDTAVNINTATTAELSYLPGIGASKAKAIVQHRQKRPFKKVEEIMRVKGIGRKSFKVMRPYLTVQGPTTATKKIKPAK